MLPAGVRHAGQVFHPTPADLQSQAASLWVVRQQRERGLALAAARECRDGRLGMSQRGQKLVLLIGLVKQLLTEFLQQAWCGFHEQAKQKERGAAVGFLMNFLAVGFAAGQRSR